MFADDDPLLVSANGQSIRFSATDEALRPMGRCHLEVCRACGSISTTGCCPLNVVREGTYLLVATSELCETYRVEIRSTAAAVKVC